MKHKITHVRRQLFVTLKKLFYSEHAANFENIQIFMLCNIWGTFAYFKGREYTGTESFAKTDYTHQTKLVGLVKKVNDRRGTVKRLAAP